MTQTMMNIAVAPQTQSQGMKGLISPKHDKDAADFASILKEATETTTQRRRASMHNSDFQGMFSAEVMPQRVAAVETEKASVAQQSETNTSSSERENVVAVTRTTRTVTTQEKRASGVTTKVDTRNEAVTQATPETVVVREGVVEQVATSDSATQVALDIVKMQDTTENNKEIAAMVADQEQMGAQTLALNAHMAAGRVEFANHMAAVQANGDQAQQDIQIAEMTKVDLARGVRNHNHGSQGHEAITQELVQDLNQLDAVTKDSANFQVRGKVVEEEQSAQLTKIQSAEPSQSAMLKDNAAPSQSAMLKDNAAQRPQTPLHLLNEGAKVVNPAVAPIALKVAAATVAKVDGKGMTKVGGLDLTPLKSGVSAHALQGEKAVKSLKQGGIDQAKLDLLKQIQAHLRQAMLEKKSNFSVKLWPEALGKIDVELNFQGKDMHATFKADQESTKGMLDNNRQALRTLVHQAGFKTTDENIVIKHADNGGGSNMSYANQNQGQNQGHQSQQFAGNVHLNLEAFIEEAGSSYNPEKSTYVSRDRTIDVRA